jgi:hypothetical protein
MREMYKKADYVLVVASPAYKRRAEHEEVVGEGDGVAFEADYIIQQRVTDRRWYERILLVVFPEHSKKDLPDFLGAGQVSYFTLDPDTGTGELDELLAYLKGTHA